MNFMVLVILLTGDVFAIDLPSVRDKGQCQVIAIELIKNQENKIHRLICIPKVAQV